MPSKPIYTNMCAGCKQLFNSERLLQAEDDLCTDCLARLNVKWRAERKKARNRPARYCNKCSRKLPLNRYFNCTSCLPVGDNEYPESDRDRWWLGSRFSFEHTK